jgi:hypothetical protein
MKKNILSQLHNLKDIKPDKQWKTDSQDFLRAHISGGVETGVFSKVMVWLKDFAKVSSQPAFALSAFVLILITGVIFSNPILSDAKPNDSLYIARIISEKAQLNMTFNKESRDKLSAQFATNHAKDITNLMNDPEFHSQEDSEGKIANLSDDFNKEINSARESINSINERERNNYTNNNVDNDVDDDSYVETNNSNTNDEGVVFSADTKKDDKGLEINVQDNNTNDTTLIPENSETATSTDKGPAENVESPEENLSTEEENASSTLNQLQSITDEVDKEGGDVNETSKALDDAQRLFNEAKYQEALEKLNEVEQLLVGASAGISEESNVE